jgi:hypothetical protein
MKIKDVEIGAKSKDEFKAEWVRQGHEVVSDSDDWLVLKNSSGKVFECIVLDDTIFPFNFEE